MNWSSNWILKLETEKKWIVERESEHEFKEETMLREVRGERKERSRIVGLGWTNTCKSLTK